MTETLEIHDLFLEDSTGSLVIRDQLIKAKKLSDFNFAGEAQKPLRIENCEFVDCEIDTGVFALWGVRLKNVVFNNFRFAGEATIQPHMSSLENVKFIDQRRDVLLTISPRDIPTWREFHAVEWRQAEDHSRILDIGQFHGSVSIYGLSIEGIVVDNTRHVAFSVPENFNWRDVPIQSLDWKLALTQAMNCIDFHLPPDGVIDYPDKSAPDFEVFMSDLSKLVELGIVNKKFQSTET